MRTITQFAALVLLLVCPSLGSAPALAAQAAAADPAAREAAEKWLTMVEAGDFQASWDEAGEMFREGTTAQAWARQAADGQQRIGDLVSRELAELHAVTDPPDAPPAEYVFLRYRSEFSVAGAAVETVVLIRETERGWRVIGYFVQPPGA
jgi:ABC-type glycerol-3-phosphate transport system substrate-binding protein